MSSQPESLVVSPRDPIPIFRIDLSLPPHERYVQMATELGPMMRELIPLFDVVLAELIPRPLFLVRWGVKYVVTPWLLRRVFAREETEELQGFARASGVGLGLLIVLNVFLDGVLGCTSGGVRVGDAGGQGEGRMMHFRTLDWDMPALVSSYFPCTLLFICIFIEAGESYGKSEDYGIGAS